MTMQNPKQNPSSPKQDSQDQCVIKKNPEDKPKGIQNVAIPRITNNENIES